VLVATRHADVDRFLEHAESFLLAREVERSFVLGRAIDPRARARPVQLYTVDDDAAPVLAALRLPSRQHQLLLTDGPAAAARALAQLIARDDPSLPAVHGPVGVADAFATAFADARGLAATPSRRMRLHATRTVADLPAPAGAVRAAVASDVELLGPWFSAFQRDVGDPPSPDGAAAIAEIVAAGRLSIWADAGEPRCMAAWTRRLATTCAVGLVYTPPEHRGHGYATACVATLTRNLLADGVRQCLLFTDLANPTSNAIYARIGYAPRLDFEELRFAVP
jgi:predicted GNAT family acetyltransferase